MGLITIKKGREKPILQQHPWIFSGAIAKAEDASPGDIVTVVNHSGDFMARGYWNPQSQIQVRILTWHDEPIDEAWWRQKLHRAISARLSNQDRANKHITGYRLVNAESDYLPGLIVDQYGEWLVLQALTFGIDSRKDMLVNLLVELCGDSIKGIYERSDADARYREGLEPQTGTVWGAAPPDHITIQEQAIQFNVNVVNGHKTGFYLDQQENRQYLLDFITRNALAPQRILNLFSYTGGFGLHVLKASPQATIINVDASEDVLQEAEANFKLNFGDTDAEFIQADVFEYLRDMVDEGQTYDLIILDPPKFAHNKQQIDKAARGYKDINLNAFKALKPGGYLMTYSCSGAIDADLFQKIVFGALADANRQAQVIKHLTAGEDHPVALTFPEGEYLKGLFLRVY